MRVRFPSRLGLLAVLGCGATAPGPSSPVAQPPPQHHAHHAHHGGHPIGEAGMHHRFENADEWAKVFDDPARDAWQEPEKIIAALELSPTMTVADIGAGTGYFSVRLARALPQGRVVATDLEADMIRYLRDRAAKERVANIDAKVTPPDDPQLAAASVDRVLVVDVWHHLGDRAAYAKKLAASLRPGGRVMVVDFKLDAQMGPPKQHRLAPEAIAADLATAGLDAVVAPVALREQYVVVGTLR